MTLKNVTCLLCLALLSSPAFSQDTLKQEPPRHDSVSFSGYVDAYYALYSDSIGLNDYQKFTSVSPRSNQFGLNVAMLTAKYFSKDVRGQFTLHYGDIPRSSWSANYNFVQEANAGIRLCKNFWLDAGFFRTHVGTEACFPKENYTSSVAVTTFMEPFYQAGFRLNYNPSDKLSFFLYALNGYNIYEDNNRKKSGGLLVTYTFSDRLNIGYSGYYGDDSPDTVTVSHFRTFHNVFLNFKGKKFKLTVGGDVATQEHSDIADGNNSAMAMGAVLILSYNINKKYRVYGRGEMFSDESGMLSGVFMDSDNHLTGLKLTGGTVGIEYKPADNSYIRLEGRSLMTDKAQLIFYNDDYKRNTRMEAMVNVGFWFE